MIFAHFITSSTITEAPVLSAGGQGKIQHARWRINAHPSFLIRFINQLLVIKQIPYLRVSVFPCSDLSSIFPRRFFVVCVCVRVNEVAGASSKELSIFSGLD